jgi:ArsR family transcriptional regulator
MKAKDMLDYAQLLRIIANPTRLMILAELLRGMKCVNDIGDLLEVPQPNVSQHLAVLKEIGLVACRKSGVSRCYYLVKPRFIRALLSDLGSARREAPARPPDFRRAGRGKKALPRRTPVS